MGMRFMTAMIFTTSIFNILDPRRGFFFFPVRRRAPAFCLGQVVSSPLPDRLGRPLFGSVHYLRHTVHFLRAALGDYLATRIYAFIAYRRVRNAADKQSGNVLDVSAKVAKQHIIGTFHRGFCFFYS
jgi:hypothetical protein